MGFPAEPIFDSVEPSVAGTFSSPTTSLERVPCLVEPPPSALYPRNWLPLRVSLDSAAGMDVFEVTIESASAGTLVVYTAAPTWTMPREMWSGLSSIPDEDVTVSVRGAITAEGAVSASTTATFHVAPVTADGTIVYWTTADGTSLKGFAVGDEVVTDVLTPGQVGATCVGCHSSTPDGRYVGYTFPSIGASNLAPSPIGIRSLDGSLSEPPFLTDAARTLLSQERHNAPVFSDGHWTDGDRVVLAALLDDTGWEAGWIDLEATSTERGVGWGVLARDGDERHVVSPSFNRDGSRVVYASDPSGDNGAVVGVGADIYVVPWGARAGGVARPLEGASEPGWIEYGPRFSPGDALVAFVRVHEAGASFDIADAEIMLVPSEGGTAVRALANDPPACTGRVSPGVDNTGPRWSPARADSGDRTFHWLTFSSTRDHGGMSQIYLAPVVVEAGVIQTYPALHFWNQPADQGNHTPAWDVFELI